MSRSKQTRKSTLIKFHTGNFFNQTFNKLLNPPKPSLLDDNCLFNGLKLFLNIKIRDDKKEYQNLIGIT